MRPDHRYREEHQGWQAEPHQDRVVAELWLAAPTAIATRAAQKDARVNNAKPTEAGFLAMR